MDFGVVSNASQIVLSWDPLIEGQVEKLQVGQLIEVGRVKSNLAANVSPQVREVLRGCPDHLGPTRNVVAHNTQVSSHLFSLQGYFSLETLLLHYLIKVD